MSLRAHRITVAAGVLVAALVLAVAGRAAPSQTIHAYFDADGHLMFTYLDGSQVTGTIPPGTYQVVYDNLGADDLADDHAFHLFGPGIDFAPAASIVQTTFNVTFQTNGSYTLQDDLHPAIGRRVFVATTAGGGSDTTPVSTGTTVKSTSKPVSNDIVGSDVKAFRGTLTGAVSSAGKLTLVWKGKNVASLRSGRYKITVDDEAAKTAFRVQHAKKLPVTVTGVGFVGKHTVTVTLDAGQWWYFSGQGKKNYFVVAR